VLPIDRTIDPEGHPPPLNGGLKAAHTQNASRREKKIAAGKKKSTFWQMWDDVFIIPEPSFGTQKCVRFFFCSSQRNVLEQGPQKKGARGKPLLSIKV